MMSLLLLKDVEDAGIDWSIRRWRSHVSLYVGEPIVLTIGLTFNSLRSVIPLWVLISPLKDEIVVPVDENVY